MKPLRTWQYCCALAAATSILALGLGKPVQAQEARIYYDYVKNGKLAGGKILVDLSDADERETYGLGGRASPVSWAVTTIVDNGPSSNRIDIVVLGDGYTAGELTDYATHVENVLAVFFAEEPLATYYTYFNVHRVDVVSNESGVDEPDNGIFRDTALDMTYNCDGIPRLLCIDVAKAYAAAAVAPDVDQILALANSTRYGGAGYADDDLGTLAGNNVLAVEIGVHEFGHSFADLADEYDYADGATYTGEEPIEPNVSIYDASNQVAFQRKWWRWMDLPNVTTYEGAAYHQFGIYRPTWNSKMRSLNRPFEEVNEEQFVLGAYGTVSPIDDATPESPVPLSACTTFFVAPVSPVGHALDIQWSIDGADVAGAIAPTFRPYHPALEAGLHTLRVTVVDPTSRVRDEALGTALLTDTRQWEIEVLGTPNECLDPIPAVSEWGLVVLTLLVLATGTIVLMRRRVPRVAA